MERIDWGGGMFKEGFFGGGVGEDVEVVEIVVHFWLVGRCGLIGWFGQGANYKGGFYFSGRG